MKLSKIVAGVVCSVTACAMLTAQEQTVKKSDSSSSKSETTVENEYMSNVEDSIITELASAPDYDNKLVALQYIEAAINDGRSSPEMMAALDSLAGEGISTQSRTNGRVMNNFPDIRAKACDLLGQVHTEESKATLENVIKNDNEPMVLSSAIRALGEVGLNENGEVTKTIAWAEKRCAVLNPTSSLAFEVLVAYEKLADQVEDKGALIQSVSAIATNYKYVRPVRLKAYDVLKKIQNGSSSKSSKDQPEK
jgi:hypothetical protein